ncbi:sialate O-acetylesterase [Flavihumibacter sp. R14]|nr:sialate O-acetylesterase [Flavihumibacter soli]
MIRTAIKIAILLIISSQALAKVELPAVISQNMVLQRNSTANLWGKAKNSARVTVQPSWDSRKYTATADDKGNWKLAVNTPAAGGPYRITFDDGEVTILENILVGEVWICSGQSNMAMRLKGNLNQPVNDLHEALLSSNNDQIRVFTVTTASADNPVQNVSGQWKISNPQNAMEFSAVGFWYAQLLQKYLKVPVGLIVSAVGGTPVRSWMSKESLKALPEARTELNGKKPEVLYNAMIAPLTQYSIKGFLWYQGEADRAAPNLYAQQLISMISHWRKVWNDTPLPFYSVQIAPWLYPGDPETAGAVVREQQLIAMRQDPNSGIVITLDLGSNQTIHPPEKKVVAERLAYIALAKTYGVMGLPFEGPEYKDMTVSGNKAVLTFEHADQGLYFKNTNSVNFEIAGADKVFHPAKATITAKGIQVESSSVKLPVAVRYAYKNFVVGDLYNNYGLPASSFRTDNWELP